MAKLNSKEEARRDDLRDKRDRTPEEEKEFSDLTKKEAGDKPRE